MQHPALRLSGWFLLIIWLASCRLGDEAPSWQSEVIAPIAQGRLSATGAFSDSLFSADGRNVLQLVYRDTLSSGFLGEALELPDTSLRLSVSLDTLSLDSDTIAERRDLRTVAGELAASSDPQSQVLGFLLLNSDGDTLTGLPPLGDFGFGVIPVDASDFFNYAELKAGTLTLEIVNELPVGIDTLVFEVRNANLPGPPLLQDTFLNILPRTTRVESYDLAGKTIESNLEAELTQATLAAADTLPVNLDDYVELRLIAEGMQASFAEAIFPDQDLVDTVRRTVYEFGGDLSEVQITKMVVQRGRIEANAQSTVQDSILFEYRLEGATNAQGETPLVSLKMPPAPAAGSSQRSEIFDLEGFTLDLSEGGTTWNTLRERIRVALISSGQIVTLSDQDSVEVFFGLLDLEPTYLEGYLGQQRIALEGAEALDLFETLDLGRIRLAEAEASIVIGNSVGIPAEVRLRDLTASNQRSGEAVKLASADLVVGPLSLAHPFLPDTNGVVNTSLTFNPENSNVTRWLSVLPDQVRYDVEVVTNPAGFTGQRDNFATDSSNLTAYLDFALPLVGVVDRFRLRDTLALDWSAQEVPEQVGAGTVYLLLDNEFPLEAQVQARLVDEAYAPVDTLAEDFLLQAALPDNDGRTQQAQRSVLEVPLTPEEAQAWTQTGRYLILEVEINTRPADEAVRIYADYGIDAALTAQFTLQP